MRRAGAERAVDAVVFDLGNVLVRWDPYAPFTGRMDPTEVERFFVEVDFASFNHEQDRGRSWAEARAWVAARLPHHLPALDLYVSHFADSLRGPVPGSDGVVRDVRAAGVRVLGLTNWSAETFGHAATAAPAIGLLEGVLVSGQVGIAKPDPRIFALLTERFDLDPQRTVFTDDSRINVEAACAAGYVGLRFDDADGLRRDLRDRGVMR
ncbi:MAG TPA: HAD family phosphatase [Cellulomonadaceae bacterium]|nr:HAD family phosphatase [Cellulomonadaceae bacterium]